MSLVSIAGCEDLPHGSTEKSLRHVAKMSEIDSTASSRNEDLDEEFDTELLIEEVKKRPPLYVKAPSELEREALWAEVCQALFKQWNDFDPKEKEEKANEVQTQWRILRDTFYKKFRPAYTITSTGKKKRKYYYFNSLSFLIPIMEAQEDALLDNNNEPETAFEPENDPRRKAPIIKVIPTKSTQATPLEQTWQFTDPQTAYQFVPPKIIQEKDDVDENTHFALMLVPMMRKLNDEQRYFARVAILRTMRQVSQAGQEKISVLQEELKYPENLDTNLMQDLNYQMSEAVPFDDGQEYPVPAPIVERPTNPQGEIQYPETDTEDI